MRGFYFLNSTSHFLCRCKRQSLDGVNDRTLSSRAIVGILNPFQVYYGIIFFQTCTIKMAYSKTCLKRPLKTKTKNCFFKIDYRLMQVKSIAECSKHSAILSTFIKPPFVFKTIVLSIFDWPLKTGFTVIIWLRCEVNGQSSCSTTYHTF